MGGGGATRPRKKPDRPRRLPNRGEPVSILKRLGILPADRCKSVHAAAARVSICQMGGLTIRPHAASNGSVRINKETPMRIKTTLAIAVGLMIAAQGASAID